MKYVKLLWLKTLSICFVLSFVNINAQGIGDNLGFQGLMNPNNVSGVKARAMGNAYTAASGDINSIFYNPAGLADIEGLQFSFSGRQAKIKTFERQQYIPVRGSYGIMELIWSGLYTPQLKDDGIRSDFIQYSHDDFNAPDSAVEYFDQKFADWVKEENLKGINNFIAAYSFESFDRKFVASLSYNNSSIFDFDRNEHVMGTDFGLGRAIADSNWYIYNRMRKGDMNNIIGALASNINDNLNVGFSFEYMWGNTDDDLSNEIFAHMQITQAQNTSRPLPGNTYYFWHDSTTYGVSGKSEFSYLKIGIGALYKSEKITFGIKVNLPYSLSNTHNYSEYKITKSLRDSTVLPVLENGNAINGESSYTLPFSFAFGVSVRPVDIVNLNLDYKYNPISSGSYDYSGYDSTQSKWQSTLPNIKSFQSAIKATPNLNSFNAGIEIIPIKEVSLMAGYSIVMEDLRPEDHFKGENVGSKVNVYSVGISFTLPYVTLDFAYEWKKLRYIDYYSYHTDYTTWETQNLLAGIRAEL